LSSFGAPHEEQPSCAVNEPTIYTPALRCPAQWRGDCERRCV